MSDPIEVLDYWLGAVGPKGWYAGGDDLDGEIAALFGPIWQAAHDGHIEHWVDGAAGTLAYLIVCDQFSRNMHRGSALAFATDARARQIFFDAEMPQFQLVIPSFGLVQGAFQITAIDYLGSYNGEATFELSLASAGALTFTAL